MRKQIVTFCAVVAGCALVSRVQPARCCTMSFSSPENPEIEIEVEFEDYNDSLDRVFYKIEIEAEIFPPSQTTLCSCGIGLGSNTFAAPASFEVVGAVVGVRNDQNEDENFDLDAFDGFADDPNVGTTMANLPGFQLGATAQGFSLEVPPFDLPDINAGDQFVLGFLVGFDPDDFDQVNGNRIQFAAGSNEPGHPLSIFQGYQQTLNLPPFRLGPCDFNSDTKCDVEDLDALLALGPINDGIPRVDATEIYDLDGDDFIDLDDVDEFLELAAESNGFDTPYQRGDANLDGVVSAADLNALGTNWRSRTTSWSAGNFNGDSLVDGADLNQLGLNWRTNIAAAPVPEPAGFGIVLIACVALAAGRGRSFKK